MYDSYLEPQEDPRAERRADYIDDRKWWEGEADALDGLVEAGVLPGPIDDVVSIEIEDDEGDGDWLRLRTTYYRTDGDRINASVSLALSGAADSSASVSSSVDEEIERKAREAIVANGPQMDSIVTHFRLPLYDRIWSERRADLEAYILYASVDLERMMRRRFPYIFTSKPEFAALRQVMVEGRIIRANPSHYLQMTCPILSHDVMKVVMKDSRFKTLWVKDVAEVALKVRTLVGFTEAVGYKAHPSYFGQFREWDWTDDETDAFHIQMIDAESQWRQGLLSAIESHYYKIEVSND